MKKTIKIWYFSGTGQCKRLAETLAGNLVDNLVELQDITSMSARSKINKNIICDQLIIIFPIYADNAPEPMVQFLEELESNKVPVMLFALWGNIIKGNSLYNTMKILANRGFIVNGGAELVAKHSFIAERLPITGTLPASGDLLDYIGKKLVSLDSITVPLQKDSIQSKMMHLFPGGGLPRRIVKLKINKSLCNQCGNCLRKCPAGAIREDYTIRQDRCIRCLSCVTCCSAEARTHKVLGIARSVFKHEAALIKKDTYYD